MGFCLLGVGAKVELWSKRVEVCGDGRNLKQKECDDGNLISGDGCSAACKVEEGYSCTSYPDKPDVCRDIAHPTFTVRITDGNILVLTFSETVVSQVSSEVLAQTMEVALKKKCGFSWTLLSRFPENTAFDALRIEAHPECSLKKGQSVYEVNFAHPWLITDLSGNHLMSDTKRVKTGGYLYKPSGALLALVGGILDYGGASTGYFLFAASVFQGQAVGSFWHFINMVQILSYLPLLNYNLPDNFRFILTDCLTIKKVVIPFNSIPELPFNPLDYLAVFITDPLNEKFAALDYESVSFIFNFAEELTTWLLLAGAYVLLKLLMCFDFSIGYGCGQIT